MPRHPRFGPVDYRLFRQIRICEHGQECPYCCHEWQGNINPAGYGTISVKVDGKWKTTHVQRLVWELTNKRPIPVSFGGLHHCDNPPCCNVWHIYPGTQKDNNRDAIRRRRRPTAYPSLRGENHVDAKLKERDIPIIFNLRAQGWSERKIAAHLHVSRSCITFVVQRHTWSYIPLDSKVILAGQINVRLKLQAKDIPLIFQWHRNGESRTKIAQRLHVSRHAIGKVLDGSTWKHLTQPFIATLAESSQKFDEGRREQLLLPLPLHPS